MIQHTRLWTATVAAAALMALPISSAAQSSTGTTTGQQSGQYEQSSSKSPSHHLEEAQKVLDRIEESALTGTTASTVRELKLNFQQLRSAYNSGSSSSAMSGTSGTGTSGTGTSGTSTSGTGTSGSGMYGSASASNDWRQSFSKIQQSLDQLNVPKSSAWMPITETSGGSGTTGSSTGTSGTATSGTGTSGTTSGSGSTSMSGASIDPSVMSDLKEFRRHVEEFYKAASGSFDK